MKDENLTRINIRDNQYERSKNMLTMQKYLVKQRE